MFRSRSRPELYYFAGAGAEIITLFSAPVQVQDKSNFTLIVYRKKLCFASFLDVLDPYGLRPLKSHLPQIYFRLTNFSTRSFRRGCDALEFRCNLTNLRYVCKCAMYIRMRHDLNIFKFGLPQTWILCSSRNDNF